MVLIEAVRHLGPRLFAVNPHPLVVELAAGAGLELLVVRRRLDPILSELHRAGARNGHVPITAIVSLVAAVGAFVFGYDTVAMAVERSASEETVLVDGVSVNHQYSKSRELELLLADLLTTTVSTDLTWGSALRPYSELAISRTFAGLTRYHRTFCSCNAAFRQDAAGDTRWCGNCPKCRFVGLMLAPFLERAELTAIIGRDLFADPSQVPGFAALMSEADKPFECVGERRESAAALRLLAGREQWRDTPVVTALAPVARALVSEAGVADLLTPRPRPRLRRSGGGRRRGRPDDGGLVTLDEVLGRRLAVWGLGAEGTAMVTLARGRGVEPLLVDDHPDGGSDDGFPPVVRPADVDWSTVDVVVRAPGVSRYRPELAAAERAGATVTTAMAVWLEDHADAPVVAVTGTKGKSTTAALAADILAADGLDVALIGNIGVPVLSTYGRPPAGAYVVEVSSYQAVDVTVSPGVVVLTSLAPDHLDWHGGIEPYYRDKLRLVDAGRPDGPGALAVGAGNAEAVRRTAGHPHRVLYGPEGRVVVGTDGWVTVDDVRLTDAARLRIPGRHNAWNLCGAVAGALLLTGRVPSSAAVGSAVDGFAGLPSRCHLLGVREGRSYVDDALASNPFAAAASVETFAGRPLTVVAGGADRGVDPAPLVEALVDHRPTASVVVLPPGADRLVEALLAAGLPTGRVSVAGDLAEAVGAASARTPAGGVVLFSPGAPTPEGGGGYRTRSRQFAEAAGFERAGVTRRRGPGDARVAPRVDSHPGPDNGGRGEGEEALRQITVITDRAVTVDAEFDEGRGTFLIDPDDLRATLGWELKPSGLCRDDTCVPVRDMDALRIGGLLDLVAVADAVRQPLVADVGAGIVAVALPAELRRAALGDLDAPPFTLPDLDGTPHELAEWSGRKKLLVTFSSWCGCRYDLPGWQELHDELSPDGFTVIAVAIDQHADDVRPFTDGLTMPVLYDPYHLLTELYAISNVPTVVWIDEDDRIARPNGEAFGSDTFADFTGADSSPHKELVRRWVRRGELPMDEHEARNAVADLSDDEVLARLHFRVAGEAHRRGDADTTRAHVLRAGELAPDDLTVWRAGMPLIGEDPFGQGFLDRYEEWRAKGSPAHSLPSVRPATTGPGPGPA